MRLVLTAEPWKSVNEVTWLVRGNVRQVRALLDKMVREGRLITRPSPKPYAATGYAVPGTPRA